MKRFICGLLSIILLSTIMLGKLTEVFADNDSMLKTESAVLGSDGLNIISYNGKTTITREEMTDVIINLTKIENDDVYSEKLWSTSRIIEYKSFSDWQPSNEKLTLIKRLYETEVIKGNSDGTFCPNNNCTYAEAVTFIVRALGWMPLARTKGEYPMGYIYAAQSLNIINENDIIDLNSTDIRSTIIEIVFKSLFTETMLREEAFTHDISYIRAECLLERYHNLNFEYGIAIKDKDGIILSDKKFFGDVYQNPNFDKGKLLCIYKKGDINSIVICVASNDFDWLLSN